MNRTSSGQWSVVSGQWLGTARQGSGLLVSPSPLLLFSSSPRPRRGYTLIEILVATALTLLVLAAVVQVFGTVSESISDARSFVEKVDQLRITQRQLKQDLEGETAIMTPPLAPELGLGYFEYVEGPWGPVLPLGDPSKPQAVNIDRGNEMDSTQGDVDDVLMFTTRSRTLPFVGHIYSAVAGSEVASQSQLAEVAWFVRGRTLYRRVLLIAPQTNLTGVASANFYNLYDLSARYDPVQGKMVANTLADLTRPENRFAHTYKFTPGTSGGPYYFYPPHPHNMTPWLTGVSGAAASPFPPGLKLPTLCETASSNWSPAQALPTTGLTPNGVFDAWRNPYVYTELIDPNNVTTGNLTAGSYSGYANATRLSEDVILTNVIGFDVKAWDPAAPIITNSSQTNGPVVLPGDPGYAALISSGNCTVVGYGAYVDLNYLYSYRVAGQPKIPAVGGSSVQLSSGYGGPGNANSGLQGSDPSGTTTPLCSVYDTWCTRFENYSNAPVDTSHDGFDNNNVGVVDNANENHNSPPYTIPLRGIQVKIRVYEPDSRQVREVTVTQSFLNE